MVHLPLPGLSDREPDAGTGVAPVTIMQKSLCMLTIWP